MRGDIQRLSSSGGWVPQKNAKRSDPFIKETIEKLVARKRQGGATRAELRVSTREAEGALWRRTRAKLQSVTGGHDTVVSRPDIFELASRDPSFGHYMDRARDRIVRDEGGRVLDQDSFVYVEGHPI